MPVVPHANTALMDDIQPPGFWIDATLKLMRCCDAVILVPHWHDSAGTQGEIAEATRIGMPIFENLRQLSIWLESGHYCAPETIQAMKARY